MPSVIYLVLGLHKSGTTLAARLLHETGIDMGAHNTGESYDTGALFERRETRALNKQLLGVDHNKWLRTYPRRPLAESEELRARAQALIETMETTHGDWGFKDPRTVLTYPFWESLLPEHRIVGIYRDPASLWFRTRRRFGRKWHQNPMRATQMLARWLDHNARLLDIARRRPATTLLLSYERLMAEPSEIGRLSRFVGRNLPDRRDSRLHRGRPEWTPLLRMGRPIAEWRRGERVADLMRELEAARAAQTRA